MDKIRKGVFEILHYSDIDSYVILRDEILDMALSKRFIVPIYYYLQSSRTRKDTVGAVTLKHLLSMCGYEFNSKSIQRGYIDEIIDCLMTLRNMNYISAFLNEDEETEIHDLKEVAPSSLIYIEINPCIADYMNDGYLYASVSDYCSIVLNMKYEKIKIWKAIILYCNIQRKIYNNHKNKFNISSEEDRIKYLEIIRRNPNFYSSSLQKICEDTGYVLSVATASKILSAFNKYNIMHSVKPRSIAYCGKYIALPHVFVRNGEFWEDELEAAVNKVATRKKKYYLQKGEKVTAAS